jgi:hypothetical protein
VVQAPFLVSLPELPGVTTTPIVLRGEWLQTDGKAHTRLGDAYDGAEGVTKIAMLSWDTSTLAWVKFTGAAGGGSGGAVTVADGADVAQGAKADAAWDGVTASPSVVAILKKLATAGGGATSVADGADVAEGAKADAAWSGSGTGSVVAILKAVWGKLNGTLTVSGTFFQATQPVSLATNTPDVTDRSARLLGHVTVDSAPTTAITAAALPLPAGASTEATLALIKAKTDNIPAQGQALAAGSTPVVLTAAQLATLTPPAAIAGFALEAGHLAAIDTSTAKIPAQGQALAAGSLPVVLTAIQQAALTPPAAITGFALDSTVAKDGTDITTPFAMPTGGVGIRGWLSAIWTKINGTIAVSNAGTFAVQAASTLVAETTKVIGTVNVAVGQTIAVTNAGKHLRPKPPSRTWTWRFQRASSQPIRSRA